MDRRRFVADVTIGTAGMLVPDRTRGRVGNTDVALLRKRMLGLYSVDHTAGGGTARSQAQKLGAVITTHLTDGVCTEHISRQLQAMLGEIHSHLSWFGRDAGHADEARSYCLEALATARLVGDRLLEIRTLASMALLAIDRRHSWEATSAVTAAQAVAQCGAGPTVQLVLALREAGAAEVAGDLPGARRALSRALVFLGRTDTEVPAWAAYAGAGEVDYAHGTYYLAAGNPKAAVPFLQAAADGLGGSYARNSAVYRAKLAHALLAAGEAEHACAQITTVLEHANHIASRVLTERLAEFQEAAQTVDTAVVRETTERVRHVLAWTANA